MEYVDRETGQFPVSIGTSLALEGLFNIHPQQPKQPITARRLTEVWINIRTLIRNYFAAMTAAQAAQVSWEASLQVLTIELETLPAVVAQQGKYLVRFYYNDPTELKWQFPHARYKTPRTEKQLHYQYMETLLLKAILQQPATAPQIQWIRRAPTVGGAATVALLTHHPHDLLWRPLFSGLLLLESHTGRLKTYGQWATKLTGVKVEDQLPFNALTLQLFGDGVVFDSFPKNLRDELKQLASTRRWSAVTSLDRIRQDLLRYAGTTLKETALRLIERQ